MTTKAMALSLALTGQGVLGKAADDEPVFILRARDAIAPFVVESWARQLQAMAGNAANEKCHGAFEIAKRMRLWQEMYGKKMPD